MTTDKVTIDRELLERVVKADASNGASSVDLVDGWKAMEQIRAILAAAPSPATVPSVNQQLLHALGEISWSNDSQWQADRARAAIDAALAEVNK